MVNLKLNGLGGFIREDEFSKINPMVEFCNKMINDKTGAGNDFLGWVNLPSDYDKSEFDRIKACAETIKKQGEVFIVIGIGGSYLGARAGIDFISSPFYNDKKSKNTPDIYFMGNNISSDYISDILEIIEGRDFSINVISKSGTTTEPALAFRILKNVLEEKYGVDGAKERIFVTTDKSRGALKNLSNEQGYETFVIPDDVGGRFSVLTAVGLLPLAVAGIDISEILRGAKDAMDKYKSGGTMDNDALKYAAVRQILLAKGKNIEILANYEPSLTMFGEWFKQLFAESEGKDQKGIFPTGANFSTDLHSIGQFIQDGSRNIFETVIWVKNSKKNVTIPNDEDNVDGLNFISNKEVHFVNKKAFEGTFLAHVDGGVPNIVLEIEKLDEYNFGYLVYFFEKVVAISGYLSGVNPFDQPGVEDYKKNMFGLLGKPGFEDLKQELEKRI